VTAPPRSLKHEYELFVEREIEEYKDSIPRSALLAIGDEAVAALREQAQTTLTELVLWEEVDRIIASRLRLPSYAQWRRRRVKLLDELRRPERWGFAPEGALARELRGLSEAQEGEHVLVAGDIPEGTAIFSAALGCAVTAIDERADAVERVMEAAEAAGLATRVRGCVGPVSGWAPDVALRGVVTTAAAFEGLSPEDRAGVLATLQSATLDGGVHLVQTLVAAQAGAASTAPSLDELRARYAGWTVSVERDAGGAPTFLARKLAEPA
jgi:hypothetical protein